MTSCESVGRGEGIASLRPGKKSKKRKHNPAETVENTTDTNSGVRSRCQSPSDLLMGEKFDDEDLNLFGLNQDAACWLEAELEYYKSRVDTTYIPVEAEKQINDEHFLKAFEEYGRHTRLKTTPVSSVLLISTNVGKNWVPPESVGKGIRFLVFPQVKGSPLFLTYMPGRVHGEADAFVANSIGHWTMNNNVLKKVLSGGLSSGNYGTFQPDIRIFPLKRYKDNKGPDKDTKNGDVPNTRLYWEVEHGNRDPVAIRQRGKRYMNCSYTRLFLACKIFEVSETMLRAGIVLWGKPDSASQDISVLAAVSFGTEDLRDDEKDIFEEAKHDRLVGVTAWTRPAAIDLGSEEATPVDWKLNIPYQGILYKVTTKKSGHRVYLLDELTEEDGIGDFVLDLRELALRMCEPDQVDSEADEE